MLENINFVEIGLSLVTIVIGLVATKYRSRITKIRKLVVTADQALADGKLTEPEIKELVKQVKGIVN